MRTADHSVLIRDFPVSRALLAHDGLMTPKLIHFFGAVHAEQTNFSDEGDRLIRQSKLYQTISGAELLQAKLTIFKAAIPYGFMDRLLSGTRLFGQLLIEEGLKVRITEQKIFRSAKFGQDKTLVWGRSHRMVCEEPIGPLCDVEEHLQEEATLEGLLLPQQSNILLEL